MDTIDVARPIIVMVVVMGLAMEVHGGVRLLFLTGNDHASAGVRKRLPEDTEDQQKGCEPTAHTAWNYRRSQRVEAH
ncbi:hypothetical protein [Roseateles puraquae]|uniref:hypothetical protein n=1 Tax=Roseateles puraquae TaxID=431059 RepID=UPI0031D4A9CA